MEREPVLLVGWDATHWTALLLLDPQFCLSWCSLSLQGNTALHHAAREGHKGVVALLVRCATGMQRCL